MPHTITNKSASELISLSEQEDRIVIALSSSADAQLHEDCDGDAEYDSEINTRPAHVHEYWGETWRVHTVRYL